METETLGDVDDNEAARPSAVSRRRGERVRSKSDEFAFTTNSERDSGGSKGTSASDIDGQDNVDTQFKTAVLTKALEGDAIAHYAFTAGLAGIKTALITQNRRTAMKLWLLRTRRIGLKL